MTAGKTGSLAFYALFAVTAASVITAIHVVFLATPVEETMGVVQKIFYFHVPAAFAMYVGAIACFIGSAMYVFSPTDKRDAFARAGAETAVAFGLIVLTTGPLWAAKAWGRYWTWDPRLTTLLFSVLIYVAYCVLRAFSGDGEAGKKAAAALGIVGAADLPLIHFSVQKWSGQHPRVISKGGAGIAPEMWPAFALGLVSFALLAIALVWLRTRIELGRARIARLQDEAAALGLADGA
jgi:heme exporter protein C